MKSKFLTLLLLLLCINIGAQSTSTKKDGYRIEIDAPQKKDKVTYLVRYWNGDSYAQDSVQLSNEGKGVLSSDQKLSEGQYLVYIKPDIQLDLLIGDTQDNIKLHIEEGNFKACTVTGSRDTELLWQYLAKLDDSRKEKEALEKKLENETLSAQQRTSLEKKIQTIDSNIQAYIKSMTDKNKGSWFASFLKGIEPITPLYTTPQNEDEYRANRQFIKDHFFDNIDLKDPRIWNTNYFTTYLYNYMEQWVEPIPDSIAIASSRLVGKTQGNEYTFKEMLSRLANQSITSPIMGRENVWVKLAEDYIFDKNITWIDSTQMLEMRSGYEKIRHNRIGMQGKGLELIDINGKMINTDTIDAEYLILYFYDPTCSHCKQETPIIHDQIFTKYKDQGMKVVAISINNDKEEWASFIEKNNLSDWINVSDPDFTSQYWMYYDTSGVPSIFVLDKNKTIIAKKIDEKNLAKFFEYYIDSKNGTN